MSWKSALGRQIHKVRSSLRLLGWRWRALHRCQPFSHKFGLEYGDPIDRHFIEDFLARRADLIRGAALELGDSTYTRKFGGDRVSQAVVLHAVEGNPAATVVGDLATGRGIPSNAYDCMILTQVLPFIYDVRGVVATCHRALKPGGALLITTGGISQISRYDMDRWGDYWRFTSLGLRRLLEEQFPADSISISVYGNALLAAAFLYGIDASRLSAAEFQSHDPDYEVIIAACVSKPAPTPDPGLSSRVSQCP